MTGMMQQRARPVLPTGSTLDRMAAEALFAEVLARFYDGLPDEATDDLLRSTV